MRGLRIGYPRPSQRFPLSIHSSGRYLVQADGTPFLINGDTPWSLVVQLTREQIATYLTTRAAQGFNAILFNAIEHLFSDNNPRYRNREGNDPFTTMTDFASPNEEYMDVLRETAALAYEQNILLMVNPVYLGFNGGSEGWMSEVNAESDSDLRSYGAYMETALGTYGNVVWCLGGDYAGSSTERAKQWNVATGILSVNPNAIITAHGARTQSAYSQWSSFRSSGFNLNNIYTDGVEYSYAATEYARSPAMPFVLIEGYYEGSGSNGTAADQRRQAYASILSGACGHFFGNVPVWDFGSSPGTGGGVMNALAQLDSTAANQMGYVRALFESYAWWTLEPKTDSSLVSSSLSSGKNRVCPALASDGSFAMIWVPAAQTITVNTNAFTGVSGSVRIRRYDPVNGQYTTIQASVAKTSAQSVATGGEGVIIVDAA